MDEKCQEQLAQSTSTRIWDPFSVKTTVMSLPDQDSHDADEKTVKETDNLSPPEFDFLLDSNPFKQDIADKFGITYTGSRAKRNVHNLQYNNSLTFDSKEMRSCRNDVCKLQNNDLSLCTSCDECNNRVSSKGESQSVFVKLSQFLLRNQQSIDESIQKLDDAEMSFAVVDRKLVNSSGNVDTLDVVDGNDLIELATNTKISASVHPGVSSGSDNATGESVLNCEDVGATADIKSGDQSSYNNSAVLTQPFNNYKSDSETCNKFSKSFPVVDNDHEDDNTNQESAIINCKEDIDDFFGIYSATRDVEFERKLCHKKSHSEGESQFCSMDDSLDFLQLSTQSFDSAVLSHTFYEHNMNFAESVSNTSGYYQKALTTFSSIDISEPCKRDQEILEKQFEMKEKREKILDINEKREKQFEMKEKLEKQLDIKEKREKQLDIKEILEKQFEMKEKREKQLDIKEKHEKQVDMEEKREKQLDIKEKHEKQVDIKEKREKQLDIKEKHEKQVDIKETDTVNKLWNIDATTVRNDRTCHPYIDEDRNQCQMCDTCVTTLDKSLVANTTEFDDVNVTSSNLIMHKDDSKYLDVQGRSHTSPSQDNSNASVDKKTMLLDASISPTTSNDVPTSSCDIKGIEWKSIRQSTDTSSSIILNTYMSAQEDSKQATNSIVLEENEKADNNDENSLENNRIRDIESKLAESESQSLKSSSRLETSIMTTAYMIEKDVSTNQEFISYSSRISGNILGQSKFHNSHDNVHYSVRETIPELFKLNNYQNCSNIEHISNIPDTVPQYQLESIDNDQFDNENKSVLNHLFDGNAQIQNFDVIDEPIKYNTRKSPPVKPNRKSLSIDLRKHSLLMQTRRRSLPMLQLKNLVHRLPEIMSQSMGAEYEQTRRLSLPVSAITTEAIQVYKISPPKVKFEERNSQFVSSFKPNKPSSKDLNTPFLDCKQKGFYINGLITSSTAATSTVDSLLFNALPSSSETLDLNMMKLPTPTVSSMANIKCSGATNTTMTTSDNATSVASNTVNDQHKLSAINAEDKAHEIIKLSESGERKILKQEISKEIEEITLQENKDDVKSVKFTELMRNQKEKEFLTSGVFLPNPYTFTTGNTKPTLEMVHLRSSSKSNEHTEPASASCIQEMNDEKNEENNSMHDFREQIPQDNRSVNIPIPSGIVQNEEVFITSLISLPEVNFHKDEHILKEDLDTHVREGNALSLAQGNSLEFVCGTMQVVEDSHCLQGEHLQNKESEFVEHQIQNLQIHKHEMSKDPNKKANKIMGDCELKTQGNSACSGGDTYSVVTGYNNVTFQEHKKNDVTDNIVIVYKKDAVENNINPKYKNNYVDENIVLECKKENCDNNFNEGLINNGNYGSECKQVVSDDFIKIHPLTTYTREKVKQDNILRSTEPNVNGIQNEIRFKGEDYGERNVFDLPFASADMSRVVTNRSTSKFVSNITNEKTLDTEDFSNSDQTLVSDSTNLLNDCKETTLAYIDSCRSKCTTHELILQSSIPIGNIDDDIVNNEDSSSNGHFVENITGLLSAQRSDFFSQTFSDQGTLNPEEQISVAIPENFEIFDKGSQSQYDNDYSNWKFDESNLESEPRQTYVERQREDATLSSDLVNYACLLDEHSEISLIEPSNTDIHREEESRTEVTNSDFECQKESYIQDTFIPESMLLTKSSSESHKTKQDLTGGEKKEDLQERKTYLIDDSSEMRNKYIHDDVILESDEKGDNENFDDNTLTISKTSLISSSVLEKSVNCGLNPVDNSNELITINLCVGDSRNSKEITYKDDSKDIHKEKLIETVLDKTVTASHERRQNSDRLINELTLKLSHLEPIYSNNEMCQPTVMKSDVHSDECQMHSLEPAEDTDSLTVNVSESPDHRKSLDGDDLLSLCCGGTFKIQLNCTAVMRKHERRVSTNDNKDLSPRRDEMTTSLEKVMTGSMQENRLNDLKKVDMFDTFVINVHELNRNFAGSREELMNEVSTTSESFTDMEPEQQDSESETERRNDTWQCKQACESEFVIDETEDLIDEDAEKNENRRLMLEELKTDNKSVRIYESVLDELVDRHFSRERKELILKTADKKSLAEPKIYVNIMYKSDLADEFEQPTDNIQDDNRNKSCNFDATDMGEDIGIVAESTKRKESAAASQTSYAPSAYLTQQQYPHEYENISSYPAHPSARDHIRVNPDSYGESRHSFVNENDATTRYVNIVSVIDSDVYRVHQGKTNRVNSNTHLSASQSTEPVYYNRASSLPFLPQSDTRMLVPHQSGFIQYTSSLEPGTVCLRNYERIDGFPDRRSYDSDSSSGVVIPGCLRESSMRDLTDSYIFDEYSHENTNAGLENRLSSELHCNRNITNIPVNVDNSHYQNASAIKAQINGARRNGVASHRNLNDIEDDSSDTYVTLCQPGQIKSLQFLLPTPPVQVIKVHCASQTISESQTGLLTNESFTKSETLPVFEDTLGSTQSLYQDIVRPVIVQPAMRNDTLYSGIDKNENSSEQLDKYVFKKKTTLILSPLNHTKTKDVVSITEPETEVSSKRGSKNMSAFTMTSLGEGVKELARIFHVPFRCCRSGRKEKTKPSEPRVMQHSFRVYQFRRPHRCFVCLQLVYDQGSACQVCRYICHSACQAQIHGDHVRNNIYVSDHLNYNINNDGGGYVDREHDCTGDYVDREHDCTGGYVDREDDGTGRYVDREDDGTGRYVDREHDCTDDYVDREHDCTGGYVDREDDCTGRYVDREDDGTGRYVDRELDGTGGYVDREDDGTGCYIDRELDGTVGYVDREDDGTGRYVDREDDGTGGYVDREDDGTGGYVDREDDGTGCYVDRSDVDGGDYVDCKDDDGLIT